MSNFEDNVLSEIAREYGVKVISKCQICGKGGFIWPCQYCNGGFCEDHAEPLEHNCKGDLP